MTTLADDIRDADPAYVALTVAVVVLLFVTIAAWKHETEARIRIQSRWWQSTSAIKYDITTTVTDCDTTVSTDFDGNVTTKTECNTVPVTHTYTRCANRNSGTELPVTYPNPGCEGRRGDYLRQDYSMFVTYTIIGDEEADQPTRTRINASQWDRLVPGRQNTVRLNIMGGIRGFTE